MTTALVVGYGSIGARHAEVLAQEGYRVAVVSRRNPAAKFPIHRELALALNREAPDYVVIANETAAHRQTLEELAHAGFEGRVLVEKPLFADPAPLPDHRFGNCAVGYNLRFHPVLAALREAIAGERIVAVQVYCGQYLPDWRPGTDWRASYSADGARGGGVLRDLSHELDYLMWLFGGWTRVISAGGNTGALGIDADDCRLLLVEFERCALATVQLNYLDRPGRREIVVNGVEHTWRADLISGEFEQNGTVTSYPVERNDSILAMHREMLSGNRDRLCSLEEGLQVTHLIAACERAGETNAWVTAA